MANKKIAGITVEIGGDTSKLGKALDTVETKGRNLRGELREINSALKLDPTNTELLAQKQEVLAEAIKNTKDKLTTLRDAQGQIEEKFKAGEIDDGQYRAFKREIENAESQLDSLETQLKDTATKADDLSSDVDELSDDMHDAADKADDLSDNIGDLPSKTQSAGDGFTVLKGVLTDFVSNGINFVMGGIKDLTDEAIEATDYMTKFKQTMGFAGFGDAEIEKAADDVKDYADRTVYDLSTIANTTAQLAANGISDYTGLTQAAGNLNAVAGGNADTFQSVAQMLTQTAGAGKLTTENWNQLSNAIPGASGKLQDALKDAGAYTGDFRDAMAKGMITSDEFNSAIMQLGNEPVAVEAASSVETFEGAVGDMQATVVSGIMDIIDAIGSGTITGFITRITASIKRTLPYVQSIIRFVIDNKQSIVTAISAIAGAIVGMELENLITTISTLNIALDANPIGAIAAAVGALAGVVIYLYNTCEPFKEFVDNFFDDFIIGAEMIVDNIVGIVDKVVWAVEDIIDWFIDLKDNWLAGMDIIKNGFINAWQAIKDAFKAVGSFFGDVWSNITTAFSDVSGFFGRTFSKGWTAVKNVFTNVGDFFGGIWDKITERFSEVGTKVAEAIGGAFKTAINAVIGVVEGAINTIPSAINGAIDAINELPGVKIGKMSKVELPRLAKGGTLSQGSAIVAEAGPELISMLNGKVQVTPLTAQARNEALNAVNGDTVTNVYQTFNVSATINNDMDVRALSQKLGKLSKQTAFGKGV